MAGVVISGCDPGDTALSFNNIPYNADITINNYGTIAGGGGKGGNGAINRGCMFLDVVAAPGQNGGFAISTRDGIPVTINNYGVVAGGGGGGGGSSGVNTTSSWGGGGGGGAGIVTGSGEQQEVFCIKRRTNKCLCRLNFLPGPEWCSRIDNNWRIWRSRSWRWLFRRQWWR